MDYNLLAYHITAAAALKAATNNTTATASRAAGRFKTYKCEKIGDEAIFCGFPQ